MVRVGGDLEGRNVVFGETRTCENDLDVAPEEKEEQNAEDDEEGDWEREEEEER